MNKPFINVSVSKEKSTIDYGFTWAFREDGEMYSIYVPGFDIYFSCEKDMEKVKARARAMVRSFFNYWVKQEGKNGRELNHLFLQLHKLGFRTNNHNYNLKRLLHKELFNTKFNGEISNVPNNFEGSKIEEKGQLAVA
jgi:hypothetical protein